MFVKHQKHISVLLEQTLYRESPLERQLEVVEVSESVDHHENEASSMTRVSPP